MRPRLVLLPLVATLLLSTSAQAQPISAAGNTLATVYVCTAEGKVVRLFNGVAATILDASGSSFGDCVFAPDGWLYVARTVGGSHSIARFDPAASTPALEPVATNLGSPVQELEINVTTLYFTNESGVLKLAGSLSASNSPFFPRLDFGALPATPEPAVSGGPTATIGLAFDVEGHMVSSSGAELYRSETPRYKAAYATPTSIKTLTSGQPGRLAVNTCGDIVFVNPTENAVQRLVAGTNAIGSTGLSFNRRTYPVNLEIDSSNRLYALLADGVDGRDARLVLANPAGVTTDASWITTCGSYNATTIFDLKNFLGPQQHAVGLAIGYSAHRLQYTFDPNANPKNPPSRSCANNASHPGRYHKFEFGFHHVEYFLQSCPTSPISATLTASRIRPSDVTFSTEFGTFPERRPVAHSPSGGAATEYILAGLDSPTDATLPQRVIKYSYATQQEIGARKLLRAPQEDPSYPYVGPYTEELPEQYFWLDESDGEYAPVFSSKRIVTATSVSTLKCRHIAWLPPLAADDPVLQNPLFNNPQTIPISIRLTDDAGQACSRGQLIVSIEREITDETGTVIERIPQRVRSNSQTLNMMESLANGNYRYVANAPVPDPPLPAGGIARYKITISGPPIDVTGAGDAATRVFLIKK